MRRNILKAAAAAAARRPASSTAAATTAPTHTTKWTAGTGPRRTPRVTAAELPPRTVPEEKLRFRCRSYMAAGTGNEYPNPNGVHPAESKVHLKVDIDDLNLSTEQEERLQLLVAKRLDEERCACFLPASLEVHAECLTRNTLFLSLISSRFLGVSSL